MRTVTETIAALPMPTCKELPQPAYEYNVGPLVGLAVESMKSHTTDEGWQIFAGLHSAGYHLAGHNLPLSRDVAEILPLSPSVVVVQDKREWDLAPKDFRDPQARFLNITMLADREDIFKLTILKDSHQRPEYHAKSAEEIGCHAWIVYYHPSIVKRLAPYVRERHLVRTYHTLDVNVVPSYSAVDRSGCLLSGAVSGVYPLRAELFTHAARLPKTSVIKHPGYHRNGCHTPEYVQMLTHYRVAICTSSMYGYALRKIIEATAAGCMVLTDLPTDEVLPHINGNLVRVHPKCGWRHVRSELLRMYAEYDAEKQEEYSKRAVAYYDYRASGRRLAEDIERLRYAYGS